MKNDKFPTTNMLVETIKTLLGENMNPRYLENSNLQINIQGELIDNGYDVLRNVEIENGTTIDLLIRLTEGFMPIGLCINPHSRDVITQKVTEIAYIVNKYRDIQNGYFICLLEKDKEIFNDDNKLLHKTNIGEIVWWGGRILNAQDDVVDKIEPIWTKEKLKMYGLRVSERE